MRWLSFKIMVVKLMAILLLETAVLAISGNPVLANYSISKNEPLEDATNIDDNIQRANGVIKSIQSEDGDIIDCIDIYKQPALSHPALKTHKIQMEPVYVPIRDKSIRKINRANGEEKNKSEFPVSVTKQIWRKSGSCPEGTVPIRRNMHTKNKALPILSSRFNSSFNRSKHEFNQNGTSNLLHPNHAMSILITEGYAYTGAQGGIAVYNPTVERFDEYSLSDISLENGGQGFYEEVRSGWMVNPKVYGDRKTRFFTYWTADGVKTGCFDIICSGFVQVNKDIALGAVIDHKPTTSNMPSQLMSISIYKDQNTNNWWVDLEGKKIGYWPPELFKGLSHHASSVHWGGDVYSTRLETQPHTATAMGSGQYSSPTDWLVGSIRGMRILQYNTPWKYTDRSTTYADQYDCYDFYFQVTADDPVFYYGGPGSGGPVSRCH